MKKTILIIVVVLLSFMKVEAQSEGYFGIPVSSNFQTNSLGIGIEVGVLNPENAVGFGMAVEGFSTDTTFHLSSANMALLVNVVPGEFLMPLSFGIESIPGIKMSPTFGFGGRYLFNKFYVGASGTLSYLLEEQEGIYFSKFTFHLGVRFGGY